MKERPILFSGPMVRALLDGSKTQTRRVVNPQPANGFVYMGVVSCCNDRKEEGKHAWYDVSPGFPTKGQHIACPYGQPGDRLWVRETYMVGGPDAGYWYRADFDHGDIEVCKDRGWNWSPSIFMPRNASRITLEIVSVRVERLNDISAQDAIAEGIKKSTGSGVIAGEPVYMMTTNNGYMRGDAGAVVAYSDLWESINGAGSWAENPWVWVIEFRRIEP